MIRSKVVRQRLAGIVGAVFVAMAWVGHSSLSAPDQTEPARAAETIVREAIVTLFDVEPSAIDMQRPLAAEPLGLDDLDIVELVMEIESRLGAEITDRELEALLGEPLEDGWMHLTPAMLVDAAVRAVR